MKDVVKSLGKTYVMPPRNPIAVDFISKSTANFKKALEKGKNSRVNPRFSLREKCPRCGSGEYFSLLGGTYNRRCANCGEAYNI